MLEFLHGAPYAVCVELKNFFSLCVSSWRSPVCLVCGGVRAWGCEELGWVLLGEVCVMGICGESRDVYVVFGLECKECGGRRRGRWGVGQMWVF